MDQIFESHKPKLNRAERRRLRKIAPQVDWVTQADRLFFEKNPHRNYRLRPAFPVELVEIDIMGGIPIPANEQAFIIVRRVAPGCRSRLFLLGPEGDQPNFSEADIAEFFEATMEGRLA